MTVIAVDPTTGPMVGGMVATVITELPSRLEDPVSG
jgi:hypothetical protein